MKPDTFGSTETYKVLPHLTELISKLGSKKRNHISCFINHFNERVLKINESVTDRKLKIYLLDLVKQDYLFKIDNNLMYKYDNEIITRLKQFIITKLRITSPQQINPKYYTKVKLNNIDCSPTKVTKSAIQTGYVYAPYIIQSVTHIDLPPDFIEFMKEYGLLHECCPKCNSSEYNTTLFGYIFNNGQQEDYKDLNRCTCLDCGDVHTTHSRVPKQK